MRAGLLQHPRTLANCEPDPWAAFDFFSEQLTSLVEIVAGTQFSDN